MKLPGVYCGIVCMLTILNSLNAQGKQHGAMHLALLVHDGDLCSTECQYWYVYQPPLELSCDPYGGRLQLQCIATGPSDPGLELQWYTSTSWDGTTARLKPAGKGYSIQDIVLGANGMGAASSLLQIEHIEEQQCFWCRIAVYGETAAAVQGNTLCIQDKSHYAGMPSCSKAELHMYTTPVCASAPVTGPQLPDKLAPPVAVDSSLEEALNGPLSKEHLHTETFRAHVHIRSSPMEGSGEGMDSGKASVDALYAAVAVCVVFVVVILILVVVIVVLCKRRSWRNAVSYSSRLCMSKARAHTGRDACSKMCGW